MSDSRDLDALAEAIALMARLRGPGGCPWDAQQTHASLAKYAIEEAHEVAEAAESGDRAALQEELGDLLLQVLFHAEIAEEAGAFTLADVATTLVEKLRRRHPHVFAGVTATTPGAVEENWAAIKRQERPRAHPLEGIPAHLPALMRAQKVISRAEKAGLELDLPGAAGPATAETLGTDLLWLVRAANAAGVDAEQALRTATRELEAAAHLPPDA